MKNLLIVYHSQSGNTEQLANAVQLGAVQQSGVNCKLCRAFDSSLEDLQWAQGLLFGTPENFGTMSGALKDFFDRTYYPAEPFKLNLPYAIFISADNDGTGAVRDIERIAKGFPLRKISEPLIATGEITDNHLLQAQEFGLAMAAGLTLGIF
ncbi:MAG: flavodoxin family protein [Porticoccaceae bacterium]|nr:flavodoxin family protein [Porticoccaceae bacterium]